MTTQVDEARLSGIANSSSQFFKEEYWQMYTLEPERAGAGWNDILNDRNAIHVVPARTKATDKSAMESAIPIMCSSSAWRGRRAPRSSATVVSMADEGGQAQKRSR